MNDESPDFHDEDPLPDTLARNKADDQSPGEMLREARLSHDYTVEDLCAQTRLSAKIVHALEDNDFAALPQPVFTRGYYRQCAKVLDIDAERLTAAYSAWAGQPEAPRPTLISSVGVIPRDVTPPGRGRRRLGMMTLLLILLLVIAGVVLLMPNVRLPGNQGQTGDGSTTVLLSGSSPSGKADDGASTDIASASTSSAATDDSSSTAEATQGGQGADAASADNDAGAAAGNSDGSAEIASGDTPAVAGNAESAPTGRAPGGRNVSQTLGMDTGASQEPTAAHQEPAAAQTDAQPAAAQPQVPANRLTLDFSKRSWVSVRDANGNRLLSGIYQSGTSRQFNGTPPYKIVLGVASGVNVAIGGKKVDVASRIAGNGTARLTVHARSSD